MSCENAEIPASEKFRAVKKLAQSTKLRQSHHVPIRSLEQNTDGQLLVKAFYKKN